MNIDGNFPTYEKQELIKTGVDAIKTAVDNGTIGKTPRRQVFTSNGTWTAPAGVNKVFITAGGGGGGGAFGYDTNVLTNGGAGGATSFGNLISLSGGGGGKASIVDHQDLFGLAGGPGGESGTYSDARLSTAYYKGAGRGGNSGPFYGGRGYISSNVLFTVANGGTCSGGGGAISSSFSMGTAAGGGGGDFVLDFPLSVIPGTSYPITIGNGGAGGNKSPYVMKGGDGGKGILIIEWWE